jgi:uncharacterized protein (TIGR02996 family)
MAPEVAEWLREARQEGNMSNKEQDEKRAAFEKALRKERYDRATRLVYADWLEEFGDRLEDDDLAQFQREWTKEWQQAEDTLSAFAERGGVSLETVADAVRHYLGTGEALVIGGDCLGFDVTNQFAEDISVEEFWKAWETWTRTTVPDDARGSEPFTCCV